MPVASRAQDCVFAYSVLEHCVFPQRFLDDLLDKVKAGGRLLLVFQVVVVSKVFGSQAVGRDQDAAKEHLRHGRSFFPIMAAFLGHAHSVTRSAP